MALPEYFRTIVDSQRHICCYCGHRMFKHVHVNGLPTPRDAITKDHVKARVYGGETIFENIVAACCQCNYLRGEISAEAFGNILERMFLRRPFLWIRWHEISNTEMEEIKIRCLITEEKRLRGKARKHPEIAYIHQEFVQRRQRQLAVA